MDTTYEGDLSSCKLIGSYNETLDMGILSEADQMTYSVNFYEADNILEIVTMCCMFKLTTTS